jgi:hypothetical protein
VRDSWNRHRRTEDFGRWVSAARDADNQQAEFATCVRCSDPAADRDEALHTGVYRAILSEIIELAPILSVQALDESLLP